MKQLNLPFALDEQQQLVKPDEAVKGRRYYCPSCKNQLVLRQGEIRVYHFAHGLSNVCTQETIIHKTAKKLICTAVSNWKSGIALVLVVHRKCPKCGEITKQPLPIKVEQAKEEIAIGVYRADVALMVNGTPVAAIEINVTHAVDEDKSRYLPIPYIELAGYDDVENPTYWEPIKDNFKPFKCKNCGQNDILHSRKLESISRTSGISIPKKYYIPDTCKCWSCHKEILVFTWPEHGLFPIHPPKVHPIPKTIKNRFSKTSGNSYWANTCPYCYTVQGDFFLFFETEGPFFGM